MQLSISEMLAEANGRKTEEERIETLRFYGGFPVQHILRGAYDPGIQWRVSEISEYRPNVALDQESMLFKELKRLYIFTVGGNDNLPQDRCEVLFVQFLEGLDVKDAELMLNVVNKKLPYKKITSDLVLKAFPGLY